MVKTVGDVAFDEAAAVAGAVTPVPGGVGAVTTMMVLENVVCGIARTETIYKSEGVIYAYLR